MPSSSWSAPIIANNMLYIGCNNWNLYAFKENITNEASSSTTTTQIPYNSAATIVVIIAIVIVGAILVMMFRDRHKNAA